MVDLRKIMKHNPADDENEDLDEDDEDWKKRCLGQVFLSDIMVIGYDWVICELSHC